MKSLAAAFFVGGWMMQFIGHAVFEKRRPAFTDNLIQLLIGPMYFLAEIAFFLGLRKPLRDDIASIRAK